MNNLFADKVEFFYEDIEFKLENEPHLIKWLQEIFESNKAQLSNINYIFCSDDYLLNINKEYLSHDYYTDIISFPYAEKPEPIQGDIFISIDRIKENARNLNTSFETELLRVMAHGVLHFMGYKDKTEEDSAVMRQKEDNMISIFSKI